MTVLELLPELKNKPEEYIKSVEKSYNDYIDFSDIPVGYRNEYRVNITGKLENIMKNISTVVSDRYNILLNFNRDPYNCPKCDTKMDFVLYIN